MATLQVSNKGRYRYTGVYADIGVDIPTMGPWMAPAEVDDATVGGGLTHVVSSADIGFLDRVAVRYYGAGMEMLWWAMCRANGITDPEVDLYPGYRLYIPSRERVMRYVSGG